MTTKPLCDNCILKIKNAPLGQGVCIEICKDCSIESFHDYIDNAGKTVFSMNIDKEIGK
jgi:NMD protein affecting ribosome stability and mRNA decay